MVDLLKFNGLIFMFYLQEKPFEMFIPSQRDSPNNERARIIKVMTADIHCLWKRWYRSEKTSINTDIANMYKVACIYTSPVEKIEFEAYNRAATIR